AGFNRHYHDCGGAGRDEQDVPNFKGRRPRSKTGIRTASSFRASAFGFARRTVAEEVRMKTSPGDHSPYAAHSAFTDIHCHCCPGIDDGPESWEASLAIARMSVANGTRTIVATPHQLGNYEKNTAEQILNLSVESQRRVHDAGLPLTILPGADVRIQ